MTLRVIIDNPETGQYGNIKNFGVLIDGQVVWDYKELNGEIRLIHDPYPGCEKELVEFKDIEDLGLDLPVVSETSGETFKGIDVVELNGITCFNLLTTLQA